MKYRNTAYRLLHILVSAVVLSTFTAVATRPSAEATGLIDRQMTVSEAGADDEERHSATKGFGEDRVMTVPAAAFGYDGSDANGFRYQEFSGYLRGTNTGDYCGMAPVYLPHGATIERFWASIYDNDPDHDVTITLSRVHTTEYHARDVIAEISSSGASTTIQKPNVFAGAHAVVESPRFAYMLTTCLPSETTGLLSARIWFIDPEIFSDGFETSDTLNWSATVAGSKALILGQGRDHVHHSDEQPRLPFFDQAPPEIQQKLRQETKAYGNPLVIPASDFMYNGQFPAEVGSSTGGYIHASGLGTVFVQAPVYLPDGADVSTVWAVVRDNDSICPGPDVLFWMFRTDNTTGITELMADFSSTGADTDYDWVGDLAPELTEIEYPEYEYSVVARLCAIEHRLYGFVIYYSQ